MIPLNVVIAGGGIGKRFSSELPKQFVSLNSKPIIVYSLDVFLSLPFISKIVITYPPSFQEKIKEILSNFFSSQNKEIYIIEGGPKRENTVFNSLLFLKERGVQANELIAIHDAVRPFINQEFVKKLYEKASKEGNCIPLIPIRDSVKYISNNDGYLSTYTISRENLYLVQTPQIFKFGDIYKAYEFYFMNVSHDYEFNDDSSIYEAFVRAPLHYVEGLRNNIKITYKEDIEPSQQI